eukprot:m51a1_g3821 hypothetical protein (868) ;mRNA; r:283195-286482
MPFKKKGCKYSFKIKFGSCTGLPDNAFCCLSWKRGTKAENHGETKQKMVFGGKAEWNEEVALMCTLFPDGAHGFDDKSIVVTVNEFDVKKKKTVALGMAKLNLADFAMLNGATRPHELQLKATKKKKGGPFDLSLTVTSQSTSEEGDASQTDMMSEAPDGSDAFDESEEAPDLSSHREDTESKGSDDEDEPAPATKPRSDSAAAAAAPAAAASADVAAKEEPKKDKDKDKDKKTKEKKHKKDKDEGCINAAQIDALRADLERALADLARARERDEAKDLELRNAKADLERLREAYAQSEREIDDQKQRLEALKGGDSDALKDELQGLTDGLKEERERTGALNVELTKVRAEAEVSRRRVAELEEEVALCKRQLAAVKGGDAALRADADRLRQELQAAHERDTRVDAELRRLQDELNRERKHAAEQQEEAMLAKRRLKDAQRKSCAMTLVASGAVGGAAAVVDEDVKELRGEIDSLKEERSSLVRKNKELEAKLEAASAKSASRMIATEAAAVVASSAAAAASVAAAPGSADVMETRLRVTQDVMRSFFEYKFEQSGKPAATTVLLKFLEKPDKDNALQFACEIFNAARKTSTDNLRGTVYWLATAWWLLKELTPRLSSQHSDPPTLVCKPPECPESDTPGDKTIYELRLFVFDAFGRALEHTYGALSPLLYPAIVEQEVQTPKSKRGSASPRSSKHTTSNILAVLSEASLAIKAGNLPEFLRLQYFQQVCNYINSMVFNMLATQPALCTCGTGLQIKMSLSQIEEWIGKDKGIAQARKHLDQLREVSNLLVVMDKTILLEEGLVKQMFPSLDIVQISHFVQSYKPDDICKTAVDPTVADAVRQRAKESPDWEDTIELDPYAFMDPEQ